MIRSCIVVYLALVYSAAAITSNSAKVAGQTRALLAKTEFTSDGAQRYEYNLPNGDVISVQGVLKDIKGIKFYDVTSTYFPSTHIRLFKRMIKDKKGQVNCYQPDKKSTGKY